MKQWIKWTVLCILAGLSVQGLTAQLSAGLRAGINVASWHFADENIVDKGTIYSVAGFNFTVPVEWSFSDHWAVQPEVSFFQQGYRYYGYYETGEYYYEDDYRLWLNYFQFALLGKAKAGNEDSKLFFLAGPKIDYGVGGRYRYKGWRANGTYETASDKGKIDWEEEGLDRWDYGLIVGGGIELYFIPIGVFSLDARFNIGLNKLIKEEAFGAPYNRGFAISIGYFMRFDRSGEKSLQPGR